MRRRDPGLGADLKRGGGRQDPGPQTLSVKSGIGGKIL
jgi:hypothetical protein